MCSTTAIQGSCTLLRTPLRIVDLDKAVLNGARYQRRLGGSRPATHRVLDPDVFQTKTFYGSGMSNNYYTALFNAQNNARSLARADGFDPNGQCSPGGSFVTTPWPGLYSVRAAIICSR
ncbi:hypothetical protein [Micromonospora echinospora]|uniref:hypothetical protein n=1 Tax=Micromonospora echinospora TaxID=1877 RepID=UPI00155FC058|nr:hypothetical protein [Micromonospora echinospora]